MELTQEKYEETFGLTSTRKLCEFCKENCNEYDECVCPHSHGLYCAFSTPPKWWIVSRFTDADRKLAEVLMLYGVRKIGRVGDFHCCIGSAVNERDQESDTISLLNTMFEDVKPGETVLLSDIVNPE